MPSQHLAGDAGHHLNLGSMGWSVDIDGSFAVVGDIHVSADNMSGVAYIYKKGPSGWEQVKVLRPSTVTHDNWFGCSVAIDGDTVVVGAPKDANWQVNGGAAYVFRRASGAWVEEARLKAPVPRVDAEYGTSVALEGDTIVIGAPYDTTTASKCGAAYVYSRTGFNWALSGTLAGSTPATGDRFGSSVDIEGERVAVGAPNVHSGGIQGQVSGEVELFEDSAPGWAATATLLPSLPNLTSYFGHSVSLSGPRLAVGAPWEGSGKGRAYVFQHDGANWLLNGYLQPPSLQQFSFFGRGLDLKQDRLLVSASSEDVTHGDTGSAFLYERSAGSWEIAKKLLTSNPSAHDENFGYSVALDGTTALIGAVGGPSLGDRDGCAYIFDPLEGLGNTYCYGDEPASPCACAQPGDPGPFAGCRNSTGRGAALMAIGNTNVSSPELTLQLIHIDGTVPALIMQGTQSVNGGLGVPFGDGLRCIGGPIVRLPLTYASNAGVITFGPSIVNQMGWTSGQTIQLQAWYRESIGSSCSGRNSSNGLELTFTP